MRRAAVSLGVSILLMVATEAWAECAWVLWAKLMIVETNAAHARPEWQTEDAFMSRDACLAAVRRDIEARMAAQPAGTLRRNLSTREPMQLGPGTTAVDGGMIFILMSEGRYLERSYLCLPDTVDPRPRAKE